MLAYVFWHWPQPGVDRAAYEANLLTFHKTLTTHKPPGFLSSTVFSIEAANWLEATGPVFEDWYLMENSAAMDRLNDGAVTGVCEQPHNVVAKEAAGGTAGLYRLRQGTGNLSNKRVAVWFSKPAGVSYKDFFAQLSEENLPGTSLWQRQMTLGPTTEFCMLSENEEAASRVAGQRVSLAPIWSGS
ncbi:MAG TPA: hypothetical protein VLA93_21205 [Pyrinomonadaceae bacterium]|nr:hypothetical protein [Pyrinomonadaceae bacterium]